MERVLPEQRLDPVLEPLAGGDPHRALGQGDSVGRGAGTELVDAVHGNGSVNS